MKVLEEFPSDAYVPVVRDEGPEREYIDGRSKRAGLCVCGGGGGFDGLHMIPSHFQVNYKIYHRSKDLQYNRSVIGFDCLHSDRI